MKKNLFVASTIAIALTLSGCSDNEVGDVSLGMFTTKDIVNITRHFFH